MGPKYVTTEELAAHFAVSVQTVRGWVRSKKLPAGTYIKVGNTYRFDLQDIETTLRATASAPKQEKPELVPTQDLFSDGGEDEVPLAPLPEEDPLADLSADDDL